MMSRLRRKRPITVYEENICDRRGRPSRVRGILISLEGIDGAGKSTQMRLLEQKLKEEQVLYLVTREPGGTKIGEEIRRLLLRVRREEMTVETEVLLYAAARAQLVKELIRPALSQGRAVLCDRYIDSSFAYQGYGAGASLDYIRATNKEIGPALLPELTLLFDLPVDAAFQRTVSGNCEGDGNKALDRIERKPTEFHHRVRSGYLELAGADPDRIKVIDACLPPHLIFEKVWLAVRLLLFRKRGK